MAVAVAMGFNRATLEQYDPVIDKMHGEPGGPGAPGGRFHWFTSTGGGVRVADVWESRAEFDTFTREQMGPITPGVRIPGPPELIFFDVHSYLRAGGR
jgi:hypothetical protein